MDSLPAELVVVQHRLKGQNLTEFVQVRRAKKISWRDIAKELSKKTEWPVAHQTLWKYCRAPGEPGDPIERAS